jgi:nucleoside-diphosphate-sugar epimerase
MKIVITGVAGFIGANLAGKLVEAGMTVAGTDNFSYGLKENVLSDVEFHEMDIRDSGLEEIFRGADVVFHLAAKNCISDCQTDPIETASINVVGTVNVFEAARLARVRKVICAESSALYEGSSRFPTKESDVHPMSFYAVSKLAGMHFAEAYKRYYGMTFTALRYFCVYGPIQDYRRTIPPVMSAFIIKLLKGEQPVIYGTGEKRRDFVYVDDINDFHMKCLTDTRTDNRTFNLGSGRSYSVLEIYDTISRLLGIHIEPLFKPDLPGEAQETLADIREAKSVGWEPRTDLMVGLRNAISYIQGEMEKGHI